MNQASTKLNPDDFMLFILPSLHDPNQCVCCFLVAERYMLPIISDEVYEYAVSTVYFRYYVILSMQIQTVKAFKFRPHNYNITKQTAILKVQ